MKWTITEKYEAMTIQEYLYTVLDFSRRLIRGIKDEPDSIIVNGESQAAWYKLAAGDMLQVNFPKEPIGSGLIPEDIPLSIVYEDDAVLVVDKPAGMATVPGFNHKNGTVANAVLGYYKRNEIPYTVHIVTRLDRDTSGLMLIAKHQYCHSLFAQDQQAGTLMRKYCAVVEGIVSPLEGTIDANIGRKQGSIIERQVMENGKRAVTHYKVKQQTNDYTLVNIKLETGRTHQIRVHFANLGYPLAGDDLYGGSTKDIDRQALHCTDLTFQHPLTKNVMQFHVTPPKAFMDLVKSE